MNELLNVEIIGNPKGQPRARSFAFNGKARLFDPGTAEGWKSQIAQAVQNRIPSEPYTEPVMVTMLFKFERPKSHYTSKGALTKSASKTKMFHTSKPDFDNLEKAVSDCLTELGFWKDDTQVVKWTGMKTWTHNKPGLHLIIERIESCQ